MKMILIFVQAHEDYRNLLRVYAKERFVSFCLMEGKCIWNTVISLHLLGYKLVFFSLKFNTLSLHLNNKPVLNLHCLPA